MKLLSLKDGQLAIKVDEGVVLTQDAAQGVPKTLSDLLAGGSAARASLESFVAQSSKFANEEALELGACVPDPGKIICVGLNYRRHAAESGMEVPKTPILFSKYANSLAAHGDTVTIPRVTQQADYEAELVVVIGKTGKNIPEANALEYVFGYCNANDLSARDLQMLTGQWMLGKTLDGFMPLGPYLVTADEVADANRLTVKAWLNGDLRQDSNTADMVFSVEEIVGYVSHYMTLMPGDVISTGTPEGVILGDDSPVWLKDGDAVSVEIEGLGRLTNYLEAEA